ncbi:MAG TPA: ChbG/HpnK family deacetylase [Caldimonas sp.]
MRRRLALCADDFGSAPGISEAIVELVEAGRLNAVSCLANARHWSEGAPLLRGLAARVDIGLHFNLTEGRPLSPDLARLWPRLPALPRLIALAHLGALPREALGVEFEAQLEAFAGATGAVPSFADGHQHVHHLPGVRRIVLDAVERLRPMPGVRNTGHVLGPGFGLKRALIEATGGRCLLAQLVRRGIAHNAALTGVYDFAEPDYRALMLRWLAQVPGEGALLFCHPGGAPGAIDDPIGAARERERAYLCSDGFGADLHAAGVALGRVWRVAARTRADG